MGVRNLGVPSATGSTTDPTPGNNSATDADTQVLPAAAQIPLNQPAALALLAMLLALMATPVLLDRGRKGPG